MKPLKDMSVEELRVVVDAHIHSIATMRAFDELARRLKEQEQDCICKCNWRWIIKETEPFFGKKYKEKRTGDVYYLSGVLHAEDDYYYAMWNPRTKTYELLSCVGSIKNYGYELLPEEHK